MIKVNLLPFREGVRKDRLREQIVLIVACFSLVVVVCVAAYGTILAKISGMKELITQQQAQVEMLKKQIGEVEKVKKLQTELQAKLDVLDRLRKDKSGPAHKLDELALAVPEKLWVESFDDIGGVVSLNGFGLSEETVATFMQQLESSPYYRDVELQTLDQVLVDGNKLQKFKIVVREEAPATNSRAPGIAVEKAGQQKSS